MSASVLDLLFPPTCAACGAGGGDAFCRSCAPFMEPLPSHTCARCAGPLPPSLGVWPICAPCRLDPPAFDRIAAAFVHGGAIADAVVRLKYRGRREVAPALAPFLTERFAGLLAGADRVAPIPLAPARRRERGYDQAALLAREVARLSGRRYAPELLSRVRDTSGQVGQGRAARLANLAGAFRARPAAQESVVLVDDVVTTGATAAAAAAALRGAGARRVVVLALSRAD